MEEDWTDKIQLNWAEHSTTRVSYINSFVCIEIVEKKKLEEAERKKYKTSMQTAVTWTCNIDPLLNFPMHS